MNLESRKALPSQVPCGKCRACCKSDVIYLTSTERDGYEWHHEQRSGPQGFGTYSVLDRKPDGSCIYLTEQGCSVHDRAPGICHRFDCRVLVATTPTKQRVIRITQNRQMAFVYAAGIERTHTLEN